MTHERITLTLGHSPDSDDLVMWWPLTGMIGPDGEPQVGELGRPRIDTGRFVFETSAQDVQQLNRRAIETGDLDITAISAHAYPLIADRYAITASGASMGEGYGPKVVVRADAPWMTLDEAIGSGERTVAIPGVHTTAYLVLQLVAAGEFTAREMLFSEIPGAVARGEADLGVLIHEAQLSFEAMGLRPVADLGAIWMERFEVPLPLGLNVVRRDLDERFGDGTVEEVAAILGASIRYAVEHAELSRRFLLMHSANRPEWRDDDLVDRYLKMYVSDLTLDMGERGRRALEVLFDEAARAGLLPGVDQLDIVGASNARATTDTPGGDR